MNEEEFFYELIKKTREVSRT